MIRLLEIFMSQIAKDDKKRVKNSFGPRLALATTMYVEIWRTIPPVFLLSVWRSNPSGLKQR